MDIRRAAPTAAIAAVGLALAGCSAGNSEEQSEGDLRGQTVSVSLSEGTYTNQLRESLPEFEEETGITVQVNVLGLDH